MALAGCLAAALAFHHAAIAQERSSAETSQASPYAPDCEKPANAADDSSCQQRRSTVAAEISARAAVESIRVSEAQKPLTIIGIAASVFSTLIAAWAAWAAARAARSTSHAVDKAQASVDEAKKANKIAEENIRLEWKKFQLSGRPFVFIESVRHNTFEWRAGQGIFEWTFRLKNHGQNPAIIRRITHTVLLSDILPDLTGEYRQAQVKLPRTVASDFRETVRFHEEDIPYGYIIEGGGTGPEFADMGRRLLKMEDIPEDLRRERDLLHTLTCGPDILNHYAVIRVEYEDGFRNEFVTQTCLRIDSPMGPVTEQGDERYSYQT
jgi:hypothetical protein